LRVLATLALAAVLLFPASIHPSQGQGTPPVRLLKDAQFFHVLREHIVGANREIVVGMFLFKTHPDLSNRATQILEALVEAQKRGVDVRVLLEKTDRESDSLNRDNQATSKWLQQSGVHVLFDSLETTTHIKAIVVDRRFVFIGSHNLTHSALFYNHELSVLIDDPGLASDVVNYLENLGD
jgi:phosphatidylserine/phosphatidylglycerophosphate/cardiolipin synthase-like enzyme